MKHMALLCICILSMVQSAYDPSETLWQYQIERGKGDSPERIL